MTNIRHLDQTNSESIARCASLMLAANPWDKLYFTREQCEKDLRNPMLRLDAAVDGDTIVGFLASMEHGIGFEPMIEYLCVDADWRNKGVGTQLISHFENTLFPNADNLYMFVSDINPNAIRLYVRLGYQQIAALPNFNLVSQTEFLHRKFRRPKQEANMLAATSGGASKKAPKRSGE